MKYSADMMRAIQDLLAAPEDQQSLYKADSAYWKFIADSISENIRRSGDFISFINEARDLVDFGICEEMLGASFAEVKIQMTDASAAFKHLKTKYLSDFLLDIYTEITQGNRKDTVQKELQYAKVKLSHLEESIQTEKSCRRKLLLPPQSKNPLAQKYANLMDTVEEMVKLSLETKKAIGSGMFVSVDSKREHAKRETSILAEREKIGRFLSGLRDTDAAEKARVCTGNLLEMYQKYIDTKDRIGRLSQEIRKIEHDRRKLSPLDIENRVTGEIDYIRDLIKLSARRLHISSCPLIKQGDEFFAPSPLKAALERILEFDPRVFKNDRVPIFGKPSVLVVPGIGNALYDWKHNQLVVPLIPYGKNTIASVASGIIEYRLDTDEEKRLVFSYSQLVENKEIKSTFQIKTKLTKEYVTWMTSEYQGFRVLPLETKKWFEREIAPPRSEIYTPPGYQQSELSLAEFKKIFDQIEPRVKEPEKAAAEDLWVGSILHYQLGKFEPAIQLLKSLINKRPDFVFAYYNLGQTCMKVMRKQESIAAFQDFSKRHTQGWWNNLANDFVRQLQQG